MLEPTEQSKWSRSKNWIPHDERNGISILWFPNGIVQKKVTLHVTENKWNVKENE